jgi:hypothetical protein
MQVTYRGVPYDTETPKQEYQSWYKDTHTVDRWNTYRGVKYRPCKNQEVAE